MHNHKSSDFFEKSLVLKSSHPQKNLTNFPTKRIVGSKISNPKNTCNHPHHLKSKVPLPRHRSRSLSSSTRIKCKNNFFVKKLIRFFDSNFYWRNAYTQMFAGGYKFFWLATTKTHSHFASTLIMNPNWHVLTKEDNIWSTCSCMYTLVN